jgi:hypothetical protein
MVQLYVILPVGDGAHVDNSLPGMGNRPDNSLPGQGGGSGNRPDNSLPNIPGLPNHELPEGENIPSNELPPIPTPPGHEDDLIVGVKKPNSDVWTFTAYDVSNKPDHELPPHAQPKRRGR